MSGSFKNVDLRIRKTYNALLNAMIKILNQKNFNQVTVNDLCEEALISRATFYIHFNDKYALLEYWLMTISHDFFKDIFDYDKMASTINHFIDKNQKLITNILTNANAETLELVYAFVSSIIDKAINASQNTDETNRCILSDFCTGGIVYMLLLQVKNHFPPDGNIITPYLYEVLSYIMGSKK